MPEIGELPAPVNLDVYRGDSWAQSFRFKVNDVPIDLTGATVAAAARAAETGTVYQLVVTIDTDPTTGVVVLELPPEAIPPGPYAYDVQVTDSAGAVKTYVRGRMFVSRDVTDELP